MVQIHSCFANFHKIMDKIEKILKNTRHAVTKTQIFSKIYFCFTLKHQSLVIWARFILVWLFFIKSWIKKKKNQKYVSRSNENSDFCKT